MKKHLSNKSIIIYVSSLMCGHCITEIYWVYWIVEGSISYAIWTYRYQSNHWKDPCKSVTKRENERNCRDCCYEKLKQNNRSNVTFVSIQVTNVFNRWVHWKGKILHPLTCLLHIHAIFINYSLIYVFNVQVKDEAYAPAFP